MKFCKLFFITIVFFHSFFGLAQTVTTIIGTGVPGYTGDGGPASAAQLDYPSCIRFDIYGNKFIADERNHVVRKVNLMGIITTVAGNGNGAGTVSGGYSGDGGSATNAELSRPSDIAFDKNDNLYIAEFGNSVIRKINSSGMITTFAGTGMAGYDGDGGLAVNAKINDPFGMVFDKKGNLYFSNNRFYVVRKINTSGIISTIAGTGVSGYGGDGGPATNAQLRLTGFLAIDDTGNLYIPDYPNFRIRKVDTFGIISTVIGNGMSGNGGDGGNATTANIGSSWSIFFDTSHNVYISNRTEPVIRKITNSGVISTVAGIGTSGYGGDGGPATAAQFNIDLHCSSIDTWGNLYIADFNNHRIRRINYNNSGVNSITSSKDCIEIRPSPAMNEINISFNEQNKERSIMSVAVFDISGRLIAEQISKSDTLVKFKVDQMPTGIYFVKINDVFVGKFLKE